MGGHSPKCPIEEKLTALGGIVMGIDLEKVALDLITKAGEAKNITFEALDVLVEGDLERAEQLLEKTDKSLIEEHEVHAGFLQLEARGDAGAPTYLLVHALDILMSAMSERDLAKKIIALEKSRRNTTK
jgi:PTS system cellobiose-specific IIA component